MNDRAKADAVIEFIRHIRHLISGCYISKNWMVYDRAIILSCNGDIELLKEIVKKEPYKQMKKLGNDAGRVTYGHENEHGVNQLFEWCKRYNKGKQYYKDITGNNSEYLQWRKDEIEDLDRTINQFIDFYIENNIEKLIRGKELNEII